MKRKLFLHIGPGKTGTSAIQAGLKAHADFLLTRGLSVATAPDDLAGVSNSLSDVHLVEEARAELSAWVRNSTAEQLVFSSEYLFPFVFQSELSAQRLSNLVEGVDADLCLVFYARRQDYYLESLYQQSVKRKRSRTLSFESFVQEFGFSLNWINVADSFQRALPDAEITVRPFEISTIGGRDILRDFLEALGFTELPIEVASKRTNLGYTPYAVFMAETVVPQLSNSDAKRFHRIIDRVHPVERNLRPSSYGLMESVRRSELLKYYRDSNRELFERFGWNSVLCFEEWEEVENDQTTHDLAPKAMNYLANALISESREHELRVQELEHSRRSTEEHVATSEKIARLGKRVTGLETVLNREVRDSARLTVRVAELTNRITKLESHPPLEQRLIQGARLARGALRRAIFRRNSR
ncbi:MAG: hypothetical protein AAF219_09190 [Myxococcota bacterium]